MLTRIECTWRVLTLTVMLGPTALAAPTRAPHTGVRNDWRERSIAELQAEIAAGSLTAEELTRAYLARIHRLDPRLHAMIAVNAHALDEARRSDARRAAGKSLGPLDGIPIVLKDNIDWAGGLPTTAGSLALAKNFPLHHASLVTRLLQAGVIVIGKANLSEWANIRSDHSTSGWSAAGGITRNPYALDRTACGSSSGSAAAVAADLAPVAVGTETDGSITCPASMNGLVGLKPTVGLVSRYGIVPISRSQDTAGPLARSVADAALMLTVIAGSDASDAATLAADQHRVDYAHGLNKEALRGARIGVLRFLKDFSPRTLAVFEAALRTLQAQGATLVEIGTFDFAEMGPQELTILLTEFKAGVDAYLANTPRTVTVRSLDALIGFNRGAPRELAWFDQELFERAAATGLGDAAYVKARDAARLHAGPEGIDRLLRENKVAALVAPTTGPAWTIDWVNGDPDGGSAGKLSAVAGYPHLTVPMGTVAGLPVGISFMGPAWSEQLLLSLGFAFETATHARRPPAFVETVRGPLAD
jgi:amidase